MMINDLTIGFIAGAIWILIGFYVCVTAVDRCLYLRKWLDHCVATSIVVVILWPFALMFCRAIEFAQKKQNSREAL